MRRPESMSAYVDLVEQAIFETEELRSSAEWDMEDAGSSLAFAEPLEAQLRQLLERLTGGAYQFQDADLPFMAIKSLLETINETHRRGLERLAGGGEGQIGTLDAGSGAKL